MTTRKNSNNRFKFRAWDKKENKWFDGNVLYLMSQTYIPDETDYEFMQSTGLLDKNGKEIFEGDVITGAWHYFEVPFLIKWDLYGFRMECLKDFDYIKKGEHKDCPTHIELCEIIGNIFETNLIK